MIKRYTEILELHDSTETLLAGRGYQTNDREILSSMGVASGFMSVLILALYINSEEVRLLYSNPQIIWLLCPLLLYWIIRMWIAAGRKLMHDDPIVFTLRDRAGQILLLLGAVIVFIAV